MEIDWILCSWLDTLSDFQKGLVMNPKTYGYSLEGWELLSNDEKLTTIKTYWKVW